MRIKNKNFLNDPVEGTTSNVLVSTIAEGVFTVQTDTEYD